MHQEREPTLRLSEVAQMILQRWPVVAVCTLCCIVVGVMLGMAAPKTYTATASLTVSPITTSPFSSAAVNQQINITTERAILSSGEVAALAAKELGERVTPGTLQGNAETAAPSGSQILEVSVTLPDAAKAADQANALAKAYLQFRSEGAADVAAGYIEQLDARIKSLSGQRELSDGQLQQIQDLMQQRTALILASASPGRIIGYATAPMGRSSMSLLVFMAAGGMGGLLLGMALALVRERTDPLVRRPARQSALFKADVVRLGDEDQEAVRWLVRTVRRTGPRLPDDHTIFVGIMGLPGGGPVGLARWLAELTRVHNLNAIAIRGNDVSPEAVDMGWPDKANAGQWEHHDVVYIEIDARLSGTRLADLADRMDLLFVTAGKRTRLRDVRETRLLTQSIPGHRVTPIYYVPGRKRKRYRRTAKGSAGLMPGHEFPVTPGSDSRHTSDAAPAVWTLPAGEPAPASLPDHPQGVLVPHRSKKGD